MKQHMIVAYEAAYEAASDERQERTLVLLTNVPIEGVEQAQSLYSDWRLRARIEHGYRFDQEQGLDVEDMRVQTVERMRRLFALVLVAAQFVFQWWLLSSCFNIEADCLTSGGLHRLCNGCEKWEANWAWVLIEMDHTCC